MISKYRYAGTGNNGTLSWLLQRISAVVLFIAVFYHFFGMTTGAYAGNTRIVLGAVLVFGVFHAVNGVKSILDDYISSLRIRFLLLILYWLVAIVIIVLGFGMM